LIVVFTIGCCIAFHSPPWPPTVAQQAPSCVVQFGFAVPSGMRIR
jgi:hypothetical protein